MADMELTIKTLACIRMIVEVVREMRHECPNLFAVFTAVCGLDTLKEALDGLESSLTDYDRAWQHIISRLVSRGYVMPNTEPTEVFATRMDWSLLETKKEDWPVQIVSQRVVEALHGGHVFKVALDYWEAGRIASVEALWERFPDSRVEIEVAFALEYEAQQQEPITVEEVEATFLESLDEAEGRDEEGKS